MNIVITYEHGIGNDTFGGGQRILLETIKEYKKRNHNVTLVTPQKNKNDSIICELFDINVLYSKNSRISFISGIFICFKLYFCKLLYADFIIAFTSEIFWLSYIKKFYRYKLSGYLAAPDLTVFNQYSVFNKIKSIRNNIELYLFIFGFKRADIKVAIGHNIKYQAEKYFDIKLIKVSHPGIDLRFIKKPNNFYYTNKKIKIIYIGRVDFAHKPLGELLEGLIKCHDYWDTFHIIGNGPDLKMIDNIKDMKLRNKIVLHGSKNIINNYDLFSEIDLAILPSNYESFMLTVYEMIAIGIVTVYNDVADLKRNLMNIDTAYCVANKSSCYISIIKKYSNLSASSDILKNSSDKILSKFNWYKLSKDLINV